ncbi:MAG: hypothetical protein CMF62_03615 [Magnetococcales bacterium]|nr:hypothetical protein [Magnetococcales bacterium]|tara:strand:- start:25871 stop:28972 length:3102 start_codon:yes stop_codon:yes gene_type:complete
MDNQIFENIQTNNIDSNPLVLIDRSGSTRTKFNDSTILETEIRIAREMLISRGVQNYYLVFWDDKVIFPNGKNLTSIEQTEFDIKPHYTTYLANCLKNIPDEWIQKEKDVNDLIIFTDGYISDGYYLLDSMKRFFNLNFNIYIVSVNNDSTNYLNKGNNIAGTDIINIMNKMKMIKYIRNFININRHHNTFEKRFKSISNPIVPDGYSVFENKYFKHENFLKFVLFLKDYIVEKNDNEILNIVHNLTITIYHLTKDYNESNKRKLINFISNIFSEYSIYKDIKEALTENVDQFTHGKYETFHEYRRNRESNFIKSQESLLKDVNKTISDEVNNRCMTFTFVSNKGDTIITTNSKNLVDIVIGSQIYHNSGIQINNTKYPVLPLIPSDNEQSIRQWIRTIYAKNFSCSPADDLIMYLFFTDVLLVSLSDVSQDIKDSLMKYVNIFLNRDRFGTGIIERDFLTRNKPATSNGNDISSILTKCCDYFTNGEFHLSEYSLWYMLVKLFNDSKISEFQKKYCIDDLEKDNFSYGNIIKNISLVKSFDHIYSTKTGKLISNKYYTLLPYDVGKGLLYSDNMILSETDFEEIKKNNGLNIEAINLTIPLENFKLNQYTEKTDNIINLNTNFTNFEIVEEPYDNKIIKMDELNFSETNYQYNFETLCRKLVNKKVYIKTQSEFNEHAFRRYPFLKNIDFTDTYLCGGFCRSILLKQKMKDFDFFFVGDNHKENFVRVLKELIESLKNYDPELKFLLMYKKLFNVFEVIAVKDPKSFITPEYNLDNFDKYVFNSLETFDRKNLIVPDENTKNYFEDSDESEIKMIHRFQFILSKFDDVSDIFSTFDLNSSKVSWNGETLFTNESYMSYKYMVNMVDLSKYTFLYESRLRKYLNYGFNIGFYNDKDSDEDKFKYTQYNQILKEIKQNYNIDYKSGFHKYVEDTYDQNEELRKIKNTKRHLVNKRPLYIPTDYPSLVSVARYIVINKIPYKFMFDIPDIMIENEDIKITLSDNTENVRFIRFIEKIKTQERLDEVSKSFGYFTK